VDYAFLSMLAYSNDVVSAEALEVWFGGDAQLRNEVVTTFRNVTGVSSAVLFQLITFSNFNNSAVVSIRGTQNSWDLLQNAQLWSSAALLQVLRSSLPFGGVRVFVRLECFCEASYAGV
jgi:hypothetical protein